MAINKSLVADVHLDGSNHSLEKTQEGRQLHPLDGALYFKFNVHRAVHPVQGSQFFIKIQLHHCPTTCSPLASGTQQRAVSGNMALEAFCLHSPDFCASRTPTLSC